MLHFTDNTGADVILDMVGGSYVERNHRAAAESGRIVQIAFQQGATVTLDLTRLMTRRLIHTGSTLRPRTVAEKQAIAQRLETEVWPKIGRGLAPVIDRTFVLTDAAAAHRYLEAGEHIGKVVLTVGP